MGDCISWSTVNCFSDMLYNSRSSRRPCWSKQLHPKGLITGSTIAANPGRQGQCSKYSLCALFALEFILLHVKSHVEQVLLFFHVRALQTSCNTGAWCSPCVHNVLSVVMLRVVQQCLDPWLSESPCACVERLLLRPDNCPNIWVAVEIVPKLCPREGVQLLNARDRDIFVLVYVLLAVLDQRSIHLTGAQDDAVDLVVGQELSLFMRWVGNDPAEMAVACELFNVGASNWVSE